MIESTLLLFCVPETVVFRMRFLFQLNVSSYRSFGFPFPSKVEKDGLAHQSLPLLPLDPAFPFSLDGTVFCSFPISFRQSSRPFFFFLLFFS